jgi:hypothetical protein
MMSDSVILFIIYIPHRKKSQGFRAAGLHIDIAESIDKKYADGRPSPSQGEMARTCGSMFRLTVVFFMPT